MILSSFPSSFNDAILCTVAFCCFLGIVSLAFLQLFGHWWTTSWPMLNSNSCLSADNNCALFFSSPPDPL